MLTIIKTKLTQDGEIESSPNETSTEHENNNDVIRRITFASWQILVELEITYQALDGNNNYENLIELQKGLTPLDLTPLEEIKTSFSFKLQLVHLPSQMKLFESIKKMHLTSLTLLSCFFQDDVLIDFSEYLKTNTQLRVINFSFNPLTPSGCRSLIKALESNKHVEELCLFQVLTADDDTLNGWPQLLSKNTTLKVVSIGISISSQALWLPHLSQALETNTSLKKLSFHKVIHCTTTLLNLIQTMSVYQASKKNKVSLEFDDDLMTPNSIRYVSAFKCFNSENK